MIRLLSFIWVVSLAFYQFGIIGSLSVDNILGPILFVLALFFYATGLTSLGPKQKSRLLSALACVFVYMIFHSINLLGTQNAVWNSIYSLAKDMLYFILPVLFITTKKDLQRTLDGLIIVAAIGAISALFSALGILDFSFARSAESRLALEYLPKSVGVITSYGDMGLLLSLVLLLAVASRKGTILFGRGGILKFVILLSVVLVGLAALQSRNIVLTILISSCVYWFVTILSNRSKRWKGVFYVATLGGGLITVLVVSAFGSEILGWIKSLGGTNEAAATVDDRLAQYDFALKVVANHWLFGPPAQTIESYQLQISFIHNMWVKEMAQGGIFAVASFLIIYIRALRLQVNDFYFYGEQYTKVLISVLIAMLVATQFYPAGTAIFWVLLGVASADPRMSVANVRTRARISKIK
ncbi:O-antigen ligase family protein [Haliea sp. E17]|uniref:O-antigen ligase family protein n=1 Tax=Haliea sp. E17 TaxID=3401576 RepID=UPI003AB0F5FA